MTRLELIKKIEDRKKQININIENLAKLSHLGVRTVNRFFAGDDVKLSTIEKLTNLLLTSSLGHPKLFDISF